MHIEMVKSIWLRKISKFQKQYIIDSCDPYLYMLGTELALDPKIKVVTLVKYYNFS